MRPNPIDSLAFLMMVAALPLVRLSLFGEDNGSSGVVVGVLDIFFCGEVSSASTPKAQLCDASTSNFRGAGGARVGGFSEGA